MNRPTYKLCANYRKCFNSVKILGVQHKFGWDIMCLTCHAKCILFKPLQAIMCLLLLLWNSLWLIYLRMVIQILSSCCASWTPSFVRCMHILLIELLLTRSIVLTITSSGWIGTPANLHNSLITQKCPQALYGVSAMFFILSVINNLTLIGSWFRIAIRAWHYFTMNSD